MGVDGEVKPRGDIDLISVVTPSSEHLAMSVAALNAAEAEKLVEAGRRNPGRVAIIDHELRFLPSFREARQRIAELGGIRYAEVGALRLVSEELLTAMRGEPFTRAAGGPAAQRAGNSYGGAFGTGTSYPGRDARGRAGAAARAGRGTQIFGKRWPLGPRVAPYIH